MLLALNHSVGNKTQCAQCVRYCGRLTPQGYIHDLIESSGQPVTTAF